jgi:predicted porin
MSCGVKPSALLISLILGKQQGFFVDNVAVKDMFAFSLGKDCTVILNAFKQIVTIDKHIKYDYTSKSFLA